MDEVESNFGPSNADSEHFDFAVSQAFPRGAANALTPLRLPITNDLKNGSRKIDEIAAEAFARFKDGNCRKLP